MLATITVLSLNSHKVGIPAPILRCANKGLEDLVCPSGRNTWVHTGLSLTPKACSFTLCQPHHLHHSRAGTHRPLGTTRLSTKLTGRANTSEATGTLHQFLRSAPTPTSWPPLPDSSPQLQECQVWPQWGRETNGPCPVRDLTPNVGTVLLLILF